MPNDTLMATRKRKSTTKSTTRKRKRKSTRKVGSLAGINKLKRIVKVARELRKPGEKWTNAIKRASKQLRND